MPYMIEKQGDQFCIVNQADGTTQACYASREQAMNAMADTMPADPMMQQSGTPFTAVVMAENMDTSDMRYFESPVTWLARPVPLMVQDVTAAEHEGAWLAGQWTSFAHDPDEPTRVVGRGTLMAGDRGQLAEDLIRGGLRGISVDAYAPEMSREEITNDAGDVAVRRRYKGTTIAGATATPFPAFDYATIWFDDEPAPPWIEAMRGTPNPAPAGPAPDDPLALFASGGPQFPPASWFDNPGLSELTPIIVTDDGRIYGHAADALACHTGLPGCVRMPRSPSGYAYFNLGDVLCADGEHVAAGHITLATGHAGRELNAVQAAAHYDNTGTVVADVVAYDDEFGCVIAGAVRPHVTEDGLRALRAAPISGDWRTIGGALEMIATLGVNAPGFPVPRMQARLVASAAGVEPDQMMALTAAFLVPRCPECAERAALVAAGPRSANDALVAALDRIERRLDAQAIRHRTLATPDMEGRARDARVSQALREMESMRQQVHG